MIAIILGVVFLAGAIVTSTVSARQLSRHGRGTPTSRLLLVIGLVLWIAGVFCLPPVAWISDWSVSAWVSMPLRLVAAYLLGAFVSRIWYALVP